jgi:hypothetical protein
LAAPPSAPLIFADTCSALLHRRGVSVFFVVLGAVGIGLRGTYMTTHNITWAIPVEVVTVCWYLALSNVQVLHGNNQVGKKLVYMEFLCLWSTIGAILIAEQLMVRWRT